MSDATFAAWVLGEKPDALRRTALDHRLPALKADRVNLIHLTEWAGDVFTTTQSSWCQGASAKSLDGTPLVYRPGIGWAKGGVYWSEVTPVAWSVHGAICHATLLTKLPDGLRSMVLALAEIHASRLPRKSVAGLALNSWNDTPGRTQEEARQFLREIADHLRELD